MAPMTTLRIRAAAIPAAIRRPGDQAESSAQFLEGSFFRAAAPAAAVIVAAEVGPAVVAAEARLAPNMTPGKTIFTIWRQRLAGGFTRPGKNEARWTPHFGVLPRN